MSRLDAWRNIDYKWGSINNSDIPSLNTPSSRTLPIRPTRPTSRITRSGLPTSEADESIQEEGSATYIQRGPLVEAPEHQLNFPHPGITCIGPACDAGLSIDA